MDDGVVFSCTACPPSPTAPAWAEIIGYASSCVDWAWPDVRPTDAAWPHLDEAPQSGQRYLLRVRHPFRATRHMPFWAVFQPPLSLFNGWEEHPAELYASCLTACHLEAVSHQEADHAWIVVVVRAVVPLWEIPQRFPGMQRGLPFGMLASGVPSGLPCASCRWGDLLYCGIPLEGDCGAWLICHRDGGSAAVVLYGEWDWHTEHVFAGHRQLAADEWATLERWCR